MLSSEPQKIVLVSLLPDPEESGRNGLIDSHAASCSDESMRAVMNDPYSRRRIYLSSCSSSSSIEWTGMTVVIKDVSRRVLGGISIA